MILLLFDVLVERVQVAGEAVNVLDEVELVQQTVS